MWRWPAPPVACAHGVPFCLSRVWTRVVQRTFAFLVDVYAAGRTGNDHDLQLDRRLPISTPAESEVVTDLRGERGEGDADGGVTEGTRRTESALEESRVWPTPMR